MIFNEQNLYICEKIIDTIGEIVKRLGMDYKENYNYIGLGNYEFISKSHKFNKDNFLVSFEINDRANNHKNLFEWKYLYMNDSNLRKLKEKLSNVIHFFENGYSDGIANEDDYLEAEFKEYTRKNNARLLIKFKEEREKLIKILIEEIFKKDSKEIIKLEKVIDIISNNEFNKKHNLEDLLYFDKSILKKKDKKLFEKGDDFYYLYYLKFKKPNEFEIIGFYSLPFSEKVLEENFKSILENQSFGLEVSEIKKIQFNDYRFEKTKRKIESYKEDFKRAISEFIILYENAGIDR
jgi:hypothetical protein